MEQRKALIKRCANLRFEVIINGQRQFMSIVEAGRAWDWGLCPVELGGVLEPKGKVREMTEEERRAIYQIADEYSANK